MEAARVLRGWDRDRAPPVNGEQAHRSIGPLHRLYADPRARLQTSRSTSFRFVRALMRRVLWATCCRPN
jgi:hypothetical protein